MISIGALALAIFAAPALSIAQPNERPADEQAAGFQSLFNGRDLSGWEQTPDRSYATGIAPIGRPQPPQRVVKAPKVWEVDDGAIYCCGRSSRNREDGYLTYRAAKLPADFELEFRWKFGQIAPEAAAKWKSVPVIGGRPDAGVPSEPPRSLDGSLGLNVDQLQVTNVQGNQTRSFLRSQAIYRCAIGANSLAFATGQVDLDDGQNRSSCYFRTPDADPALAPRRWHDCRIVCQGTQMTHWLDGKEVLTEDLATVETLSPDVLASWKKWKAGGLELRLESEGYQSWYRDIRLRAIQSAATQSAPTQGKL